MSASVAHESGDLVIWVHLSPSPSDRHSFGVLSAHVINTATAHPITPRIDVFDHSNVSACVRVLERERESVVSERALELQGHLPTCLSNPS